MQMKNRTLRRLMFDHDITQEELSKRTGILKSTIGCFLNGKTATPNYFSVKKLAQYFDVDIDSLFDDGSRSSHEFSYFTVRLQSQDAERFKQVATDLGITTQSALISAINKFMEDCDESAVLDLGSSGNSVNAKKGI